MFWSRTLSQKIGCQGQKDVIVRIVPSNFQKLILIIYSLLKMTNGCYSLASDPEPMKTPIKSIFSNTSNYTQCFNIHSSHQFALIIRHPLSQSNLTISFDVNNKNRCMPQNDRPTPFITFNIFSILQYFLLISFFIHVSQSMRTKGSYHKF